MSRLGHASSMRAGARSRIPPSDDAIVAGADQGAAFMSIREKRGGSVESCILVAKSLVEQTILSKMPVIICAVSNSACIRREKYLRNPVALGRIKFKQQGPVGQVPNRQLCSVSVGRGAAPRVMRGD